VKNSRTDSKSASRLAKLPVVAGRESELQSHHVFKDAAGQNNVGAPAGRIDEPAAQQAQQDIEQDRQPDAQGQHPQRCHRLVGQHAIVHIHDEQRRCQRQHVDEAGGYDDLGIGRPQEPNRPPEPVPWSGSGMLALKLRRLGFRLHQNSPSGICRFEVTPRHCGAAVGVGIVDLGLRTGRVS
jgi:hypothetical protein